MYSKLIKHFSEKPVVYAPSTSPFWDDVHISKYMLEAHLTPEVESASRKLSFIKESVNWISDICILKEEKKILDLGCGAGIYSELFYKASFNVTGIDFSKRSIEYATKNALEKNMQINYLYQNYLDMNYESVYDIVVLIYCDFGVMSPSNRQLLLVNIRKALKEDGILILDGFTSRHLDNFSEKKSVNYYDSGFWSEEPHICIQSNYLYQGTQNCLEQYTIITQDNLECYNIWNQIFNTDSLSNELKTAGFENIELYDNVCGKPLTKNSKTICATCRRRVYRV